MVEWLIKRIPSIGLKKLFELAEINVISWFPEWFTEFINILIGTLFLSLLWSLPPWLLDQEPCIAPLTHTPLLPQRMTYQCILTLSPWWTSTSGRWTQLLCISSPNIGSCLWLEIICLRSILSQVSHGTGGDLGVNSLLWSHLEWSIIYLKINNIPTIIVVYKTWHRALSWAHCSQPQECPWVLPPPSLLEINFWTSIPHGLWGHLPGLVVKHIDHPYLTLRLVGVSEPVE